MSTHLPPAGDILGFSVTPATLGEAVTWADAHLEQRAHTSIVTANPEMIMQGREHAGLGQAMHAAGLIIPDGAGAVWALNLLYNADAKRLPGIELAEALLSRAADAGWRVAMVGASAEVITEAVGKLDDAFSGLNIVYAHHGFVEDPDALIPEVLKYKPNLVLVALGVPRQEIWIQQLLAAAENIDNGLLAMGVGGSFDVWSGLKERAPAAYRALNMEWFYRIASEPWRLKRVWKTLPGFVLLVLWHWLSRKQPASPAKPQQPSHQ